MLGKRILLALLALFDLVIIYLIFQLILIYPVRMFYEANIPFILFLLSPQLIIPLLYLRSLFNGLLKKENVQTIIFIKTVNLILIFLSLIACIRSANAIISMEVLNLFLVIPFFILISIVVTLVTARNKRQKNTDVIPEETVLED